MALLYQEAPTGRRKEEAAVGYYINFITIPSRRREAISVALQSRVYTRAMLRRNRNAQNTSLTAHRAVKQLKWRERRNPWFVPN